MGKFLQLREGCGSRKPLPRLSAGTSASSGEERCLGSPGLYPHLLGSKISGRWGGRVRNPDSVSAASTYLTDQGVRVGCCPLSPGRPSSPQQWFAELLSQLLPDKVDSYEQPWVAGWGELCPSPLQAGIELGAQGGGKECFQLWGAHILGGFPFKPLDRTQTPNGTFLCPRPLACSASWATPAAVSRRSYQAAELMSSNEIRARVAGRVLLSVAW